MKSIIETRIKESIAVKERILLDEEVLSTIERLIKVIISILSTNGKILFCGNGGSASDALHMAGEFVGRFQKERDAWSAITLNSDVTTMTSIANDYGYENIFSRQVSAHIRPGDLLICFSTSGNSENIYRAAIKAHEIGGEVAVFTGGCGGKLKGVADYSIVIPDTVTARIQESHITIGHIICELVEISMIS